MKCKIPGLKIKLSKTKIFTDRINCGYQYYSKLGMVDLFRGDGCKMVELWKIV